MKASKSVFWGAAMSLAGLGALLTAQAASAQSVRWNMSNEYPPASLAAQGDKEFADRLRERSGGRIQITNQFGGALGIKSADHFVAVEDGAVAIASTPTDKLLGVSPIFGLFSVPFLMPDVPRAKMLVESARKDLDAVFDKAGQTLLFTSPWTPSGIWATSPIRGVADLKSLKLRTFDASSTKTMSAAGVVAVQLTWGDVFPALSTGTINSVMTSDETGVSSKIWEHTKVFNAAGFSVGINLIHINKREFAKLGEADRKLVLDVAAEVETWAWQKGLDRQTQNFATMRQNGVTIVEAMPDDVVQQLQAAAAPLRADWEKAFGVEKGKAILAEYEARKARR